MQKKIVLHITDLDCGACVVLIDGELEDVEGIYKAQTNYAASQTEVSYDPKKITPKRIVSVIKKAGYDAAVLMN